LPTNADKRPDGWKSVKSTWRCEGPQLETELQKYAPVSKIETHLTYVLSGQTTGPRS
jgi:hypothetical protein